MSSKIPTQAMSLNQFMLRSKVLKLYRDFLRASKAAPDPTYRTEIQNWVRADFKKNKHHTDEAVIKMMLSHGERSLKELQRSVNLSR